MLQENIEEKFHSIQNGLNLQFGYCGFFGKKGGRMMNVGLHDNLHDTK